MINELTQIVANHIWNSVKDCLPEDKEDPEGHVFCLVIDRSIGMVVRPYSQYHKCWDGEDADDYYCDSTNGNITHWMNLPPGPSL